MKNIFKQGFCWIYYLLIFIVKKQINIIFIFFYIITNSEYNIDKLQWTQRIC